MPTNTNGSEQPKKLVDITSGSSREYLITAKRGPQATLSGQIQPLSAHQFQSTLTSTPAIKVKKIIPRHGASAPMSMSSGEATDVVVADIDESAAPALRASAFAAGMIIEPNEPLDYVGMSPFRAPAYQPPFPTSDSAPARKVQIRVTGVGDAPLGDANVMLQGEGFMQVGKTNARGDVTLDLWTNGATPARYVWVKPRANHWDRYIATPDLVDGSVNVIRLQAFTETISGFPDTFTHGWGQQAMGLPRRPDFAKGKGVKIAIIDSGCDVSHPLLNHIKLGLDASTEAQRDGWKTDTIGHGSHVAGVIGANGGTGTMFTGFVPEAEIHIIKVFPGGYDSLIQGLNYCIAQKIDVVNMSLGGSEMSLAVEQALQEATLAGVACIVAAGNSGDAVKYPASSPNSLAVSAVGMTTETRAQSWAQTQIMTEATAADGTYAARFSCHGPQIGVCAPGVAIVSTLPGDSFGVDDGTSMASPHVAGLAALLLAHHPAFGSTYRTRNSTRVAVLFSMLRALCVGYDFADGRSGAGLPSLTDDAVRDMEQGASDGPAATGFTPASAEPGVNVGTGGGEVLHTLSAGPEMVGRSSGPSNWLPVNYPTIDWVPQQQATGHVIWIPSLRSPPNATRPGMRG